MNIRLFVSRTALTFLIAVASLIAGFSVAIAGPVGRDMDRDFEGSLKVPASERPIHPNDLVFLYRSTDRRDRVGYDCYELVAIQFSTGSEMSLEPCFNGTQKDAKDLVQYHRHAFEQAFNDGRRLGFSDAAVADRDSAEERADRRRAAKEFQ